MAKGWSQSRCAASLCDFNGRLSHHLRGRTPRVPLDTDKPRVELRLLCLLFVVAGLLQADGAAAQARPGAVSGRVVDFDGTPLPGIAVRLEGPFPQNTIRELVADANARFVFRETPPGRYRLAVELPGVDAGSDLDVTVRAGTRVETTLVLNLLGTTINVIVRVQALPVEDADLADPEGTAGQRIVPGTTISRLPLAAEQAMEVLPLMPGVIRSDSGQLAIDGALPTDSVLLFNGIDLMDPYSGEYSVRLPIESVDRVTLFAGVVPSQYGDTVGGVVDISTLPGGESWEWGVASFFPRPRFQDGKIQGISNASPRLRVSGPIKPGETYVAVSGEYHFDRINVEDVPGDPAQDHVKVQGWDATAQVDWRPSDRHSFTVSGLLFPQHDSFVGLDGLTPPEATFNVERDAEALFARHTYRADPNRSLETMIQYNRIGISSEPQGAAPYEVLTNGFGGNQFHREDRQTSHTQIQVNYSRRPERGDEHSHLVQIGADFHRLHLSGQFANDTILVRGVDGRLLQRIDFTDSPDLSYSKYEWAGYFQDRWSHGDGFWCDFGVRISGDTFTDTLVRIGPRIGVAWDPVGGRRTLLKVGAGIMYRRVYLGEILWEDLPVRLETTFAEDGGATLVPLVAVLDDEISAPRTLLLTGDFSHRLESGWLFRTKFSHRSGRNNIIAERVEPPGVALEGDDPLPFFAQNPTIEAGSLFLSNAGESTSWSLEVTAAKRITSGGELVVSYVRSSSFGDLNDFTIMAGDIPDSIIRQNRRAQRALDVPHRILAWATINLPADVQLAPVFEWRTGFPYSALAEDQSYFGDPNTERLPNFFSLDLQATKGFTVRGVYVVGGVKLTNMTSHDNPRQVIANVADPAFREVRNSVPLRLRAKFSFSF